MAQTIRPLRAYLMDITDPRDVRGRRHPLVAILRLCCVALMSGCKNPRAIANWWKNRQGLGPFLQRLGFTKPYGPSKSTLYLVLSQIPVEMLEARLRRWGEENLAVLPPAPDGLEGEAIDGKTLLGSRKQGAENVHLLSVFSHRLGMTLHQLAVKDKTNEIGAMPDLLIDLVIEGRVFTMDALLTQRPVAQTIIDGQGDYVMLVKDNHPTMRADIEFLFAQPQEAALVDDRVTTTDKAHGRLEVRRETVYGLSSLSPQRAGAAQLLELTRGQWSIENRSHWVRDVTLGEDHSQVRVGHLPQVMAALRNCVISLLRLLGSRFIPDAFDYFAARSFEALTAIGC
jgi:predicted transposase YbfD/YdcC